MTFRVPKIKSCCCLSLEIGSKIIGFLHLLFFVAAFVTPLLWSSSIARYVSYVQRVVDESFILNVGLFSALMVCGIFQKNYHLIFPWILFQTTVTIFIFVSLVANMAYFGLTDVQNAEMIIEFFVIVIQFASTLVVYNHFRIMKEERVDG